MPWINQGGTLIWVPEGTPGPIAVSDPRPPPAPPLPTGDPRGPGEVTPRPGVPSAPAVPQITALAPDTAIRTGQIQPTAPPPLSPLSQSLADLAATQRAEFGFGDTGGRGSRAARADFLAERSIALATPPFTTPFHEAAARLREGVGFLLGTGVGAAAGLYGGIEAGLSPEEVLQETAAGAVAGQQQLSRAAFDLDLDPSPQVDLGVPSGERPWWWDIPGGPGLWDEIRQASEAGFLYPIMPVSLQKGLGWTDTAMIDAGYTFDEATNKWVLAESESLEDAQAALGGAGYGYGQYPAYNINYPAYPSPARSAQGMGLVNWRI